MENFDIFCREQLSRKQRNETNLPITAYRSLETATALHETVVTLRESLEEAKLEINLLKSQIAVKDSIKEGKLYRYQDIILHEPEKKKSNCDKDSENYDNCEASSILIVNNGSEIFHCKNQQSKIDISQNGDAINQSIGSNIETGKLENIFKKRSARMAANIDVKIRLTSSASIRDRENDSNITSDNNSVENATPILNENERNVYSVDKHFQLPFEEEPGAVGGADDSDECLDDIELIFSSGGKQYPQDDLVSISYYEPWQLCGQSGTPVLIKFHSISEIEGFHDSTTERNELSSSLSPITKGHLYKSVDQSIHSEEIRLKDNFSEDEIDRCYDSWKHSFYSNQVTKDDNSLERDEKFETFEPVQLSYINARNDHNKIFAETDESKDCRIYRPLIHRNALGIYLNEGGRKNLLTARKLSATKFAQNKSTSDHCHSCGGNDEDTTKRSISAQTDISALPGHWRSDSHLLRGIFVNGVCTLPSNFTNLPGTDLCNHLLKVSEMSHERRQVLLSDIKFTSMVPEISRSADHLCHAEKDQTMKKPRATPPVSAIPPEVSRWFVEVNRFDIPDSNQSSKKHSRSRSCPLKICKHCLNCGKQDKLRILFKESKSIILLGSLPNIDKYTCSCHLNYPSECYGDSCGSTESVLNEADDFLHELVDKHLFTQKKHTNISEYVLKQLHDRCSENDLKFDSIPPVLCSPFLPTSTKCLKTGYLAKVITKSGRLVIGRIRYIGPLVTGSLENNEEECAIFVGLQLRANLGECDGSFEGRKIFDCEPRKGLFVPFKKVVMAWKT